MDNNLLENINIFSSVKALNDSKYTGFLDLSDLIFMESLQIFLNLFSSNLKDSQIKLINNLLTEIQFSNQNVCNYNNYDLNNVLKNNAPIISNINVSYNDDYFNFTKENLIPSFIDIDGDLPEYVVFESLPVNGSFVLNNNNVLLKQVIKLDEIITLKYTRTVLNEVIDTFNFRISDNNINTLFSNMATMTININQAINQPPDNVGINSINTDSGFIHVFTQANFTTETTPIYSDPEGDVPENIRITQLPTTGVIKLNNINILQNQEISYNSIGNGELTYSANPGTVTSYIDTFNFSISDVGSQQFTTGGVFTINVAEYVNQAPTVGDSSITVDEGDAIIFTRAMFVNDSDPAYSDPENDSATSIRFPTLPLNGLIKLNNINVTVNQEILLSDIDNSLLTYTQASNAGNTTPTFTFDIKDSSNNWSI